MYQILKKVLFLGTLATLAACANLNTISRTTSLPSGDNGVDNGKAIHLDIQQRLLIVNELGTYCAEPSPDALAAYAAAAGIGASSPASGALSAAAGGQSSAASVGLRTQSITLMRDALYRMCEAYANGAVGRAQVSTLLNRSQDLTAVILAVEQLTGAVAANQAALTGTTDADATASLLTNSKQLDLFIADENRKQQRLDTAIAERDAAKLERDAADRALIEAQANRDKIDAETPPATDEKKSEAKADVTFRQAERDRNQSAVEATERKVTTRQTALDKAQLAREGVEDKQDAAISAASAATSSAAQFSRPVPRVLLDKAATEAIAKSVETMVLAVLKKKYVLDSCMSVITTENLPDDKDARAALKESKRYCRTLVTQLLLVESAEGVDRIKIVNQELARLTTRTIARGKEDITLITECISSNGVIIPSKRDKLFNDANKDGKIASRKLLLMSVTTPRDLRRLLAQLPDVLAAMAKAAKTSTACAS